MITPISLENDVEVIERQLEQVRSVGAKRFHIDIIDGYYADNLTIAPADLQALDLSSPQIDIHLLVDDPTAWLPECVALKPNRIMAQVEKMGNIEHFVDTFLEHKGIRIGLGLDLYTPSEAIPPSLLERIDTILLMSVKAGFSGSIFNSKVLDKLKKLKAKFKGEIVVDGGINPTTYKIVMAAGASEAAANSALWRGDFETNWRLFESKEDKS